MENELMELNMEGIEVRQGSVIFPFYEDLKQQALKLAADMETIEINEETIKDSKKLLALVNKRVKELEDRRIKIKRLTLEPYDTFEKQVKEIVAIVKGADEILRSQVRELEEAERFEKELQLSDIFSMRAKMYTLGDLICFKDFLKPKHLNKTQSLEKTEEEMIDFLERTEKDIKVIQGLPQVEDHIAAYMKSFDLAIAMTEVRNEKERRDRIEASQAVVKNDQTIVMKTFTVYDEKDFLLVEMYMKNNRIKFTVEG